MDSIVGCDLRVRMCRTEGNYDKKDEHSDECNDEPGVWAGQIHLRECSFVLFIHLNRQFQVANTIDAATKG